MGKLNKEKFTVSTIPTFLAFPPEFLPFTIFPELFSFLKFTLQFVVIIPVICNEE